MFMDGEIFRGGRGKEREREKRREDLAHADKQVDFRSCLSSGEQDHVETGLST